MTASLRQARLLSLLVPAALLAGAWFSQLVGHLYPCEMCHWQRWPHYAALVAALAAFARPGAARPLVGIAALLVAVSGAIGVFHAGVEWYWWPGITGCSSTVQPSGTSAAERLDAIMRAPFVRCDQAQWRLAGLSLAGWNAILSLAGAAAIAVLLGRRG